LPKADQVTKLEKKDRVMFIFAGKPHENTAVNMEKELKIQLNDRLSDVSEIRNFVLAERAARNPELEKVLTTSSKS
jgi:hypothetical protein